MISAPRSGHGPRLAPQIVAHGIGGEHHQVRRASACAWARVSRREPPTGWVRRWPTVQARWPAAPRRVRRGSAGARPWRWRWELARRRARRPVRPRRLELPTLTGQPRPPGPRRPPGPPGWRSPSARANGNAKVRGPLPRHPPRCAVAPPPMGQPDRQSGTLQLDHQSPAMPSGPTGRARRPPGDSAWRPARRTGADFAGSGHPVSRQMPIRFTIRFLGRGLLFSGQRGRTAE